MSARRGLWPVVLIDPDGLYWLYGMDWRGRLFMAMGRGWHPDDPKALEGRTLAGPTGWIKDKGARRLARQSRRYFMSAVDRDPPPLPRPRLSAQERRRQERHWEQVGALCQVGPVEDAEIDAIVMADLMRALAGREGSVNGDTAQCGHAGRADQ